ncbi:hypothetical protein Ga0061069_104174 [Thiomonas bhubaneswarensis]|uniref:Uncharacterized protein n=1 Tax=Thiomonas bhubaneswarensis TaxID=339866 RepID=A0A0K6I044_9BURK|nr:hypothetical protein Ga0061069_104174 [Thiomonas bhubaneswarensis]
MSAMQQCRFLRRRAAGAFAAAARPALVQAQEQGCVGNLSPPSSAGLARLGAVEVPGPNQGDKREDPTSKFIVSGEDLAGFGDCALGEVLRRTQVVTALGSGMLGTCEIKLRGLGNGDIENRSLRDATPSPENRLSRPPGVAQQSAWAWTIGHTACDSSSKEFSPIYTRMSSRPCLHHADRQERRQTADRPPCRLEFDTAGPARHLRDECHRPGDHRGVWVYPPNARSAAVSPDGHQPPDLGEAKKDQL